MGSDDPRSAAGQPFEDTAARTTTVLAGDIGGTNARLALVLLEGTSARIVFDRTYRSDRYGGLVPIAEEFLAAAPPSLEAPVHACFAVAGPVRDGRVRATNLSWLLDERSLATGTGIPSVRLINDFAAVARGLLRVPDSGLVRLHEGRADPDGVIAVLGPGTGFGHGMLVGPRGHRAVLSSEAGHAALAPADEIEWAFVQRLREQYGHASWERLVSGPGLVELYRFLAEREPRKASAEVRAALESGEAAPAITRAGLEATDDLAVETLDRFVRALAVQAGNFALSVYATGGVYIAGGIAPRVLPRLKEPDFIRHFLNKGRLSPLLEGVPVHVVTETRVGLLGAAAAAIRTDEIIGSREE